MAPVPSDNTSGIEAGMIVKLLRYSKQDEGTFYKVLSLRENVRDYQGIIYTEAEVIRFADRDFKVFAKPTVRYFENCSRVVPAQQQLDLEMEALEKRRVELLKFCDVCYEEQNKNVKP